MVQLSSASGRIPCNSAFSGHFGWWEASVLEVKPVKSGQFQSESGFSHEEQTSTSLYNSFVLLLPSRSVIQDEGWAGPCRGPGTSMHSAFLLSPDLMVSPPEWRWIVCCRVYGLKTADAMLLESLAKPHLSSYSNREHPTEGPYQRTKSADQKCSQLPPIPRVDGSSWGD